MKKLLVIFLVLFSFGIAQAQIGVPGLIKVRETDEDPAGWVYELVFTNGGLAVSGSTGTIDLTAGAGQPITLDLGDDGGDDSVNLGEIAVTNDTNSIFTEPSADKLLIDVSQNWPTADVANAGDSATAFFSEGTIEDDYLPVASGTTAGIAPTTSGVTDGWVLTVQADESVAWEASSAGVTTIAAATDTAIADPAEANILIYDGSDSWDNKAVSGDMTISAAGAVTIGNDKILEAHLKAVDAAGDEQVLTYESTTGDFEWHTAAEVLGNISTTQGTILYRSDTAWVALDPGVSGQYLQTKGAAANPEWASTAISGDIETVGDVTSGAAFTEDGAGNTLYFEGATANAYEIILTGADPGADVTITLPAETGTVLLTDGTNTDNAVLRSDGTGSLAQTSAVVIDDSNNVTGVVGLTMTGVLTAGSGANVLTNAAGLIDGEKIQDDSIDDDALDFSDITGADLTLTDCTTITASGTITGEQLTSTDDADINDTLTVGDIVIDEAVGTIVFSGATSATITSTSGAIGFDNENLSTTGTLAAGATTLSGNLTLDDGSGASPSLIFQDATNETWTISKADAGDLDIVINNASDRTIDISNAGDGVANVTLDGTLTATAINTGTGTEGSRAITMTSNDALTPSGNQIYYVLDKLMFSEGGDDSPVAKTPMKLEDAQTATGKKTFQGDIAVGDASNAGTIDIYDGSSNYWQLAVPSLSGDYTLTLPTGAGTTGQYLKTTTTGTSAVLSWDTPSASANTDGGTGGVQFNAGGVLTADTGFVFTTATDKLTLGESGGSTTGSVELYYTGTTYAATILPNVGMSSDVNITLPSSSVTLLGSGDNTFTGSQVFSKVNAVSGSADSVTASGTLGIFNGSDTFRGLYLDYTNANHTGTGNTVVLIDTDAIAGDANSNLYGIRIGNLTGTTGAAGEVENAIKIGTGWDDDIELADNTATITHSGTTSLTIASTSGTVIVEGVTFTGAAVTGVSDLTTTGDTIIGDDLSLTSDGAVINIGAANDVTITHSANTLTLGGGNLALGANNLTMTGSLAATGARVTKGWFTDVEITNLPTVGGNTISPTNVTPVDTADENAAFYPLLVGGATGTQATETDGELSYNPSTDTLTVANIAGTSLIATGVVDGLTNVTLTTDGSEDANVTGKMSHVIINKHTTEATAFAVTLPATAIAGMQLLVKNGYGDDAPTTGVITVYVPATHYAWNPTTKTQCAQGYDLVSGGAAGDFIGMVAISDTVWESFGAQGTWTCTVTP